MNGLSIKYGQNVDTNDTIARILRWFLSNAYYDLV